jgi:hypothetical protein
MSVRDWGGPNPVPSVEVGVPVSGTLPLVTAGMDAAVGRHPGKMAVDLEELLPLTRVGVSQRWKWKNGPLYMLGVLPKTFSGCSRGCGYGYCQLITACCDIHISSDTFEL